MKSRILVATSCMLCLLCTLNVEASVPKKSKATPVQTKEQKEVIKEDTLFDLSQSLTDNVSSTDSDSSYDDDKPMPLGAITIRNGIAYRHDDNKPLGGPTKRKKQATPEKTKQQTTSKQQITENKENSTINYNDIRKELCSENITKDRLTEILSYKDIPADIREMALRARRMLRLEKKVGKKQLENIDIQSSLVPLEKKKTEASSYQKQKKQGDKTEKKKQTKQDQNKQKLPKNAWEEDKDIEVVDQLPSLEKDEKTGSPLFSFNHTEPSEALIQQIHEARIKPNEVMNQDATWNGFQFHSALFKSPISAESTEKEENSKEINDSKSSASTQHSKQPQKTIIELIFEEKQDKLSPQSLSRYIKYTTDKINTLEQLIKKSEDRYITQSKESKKEIQNFEKISSNFKNTTNTHLVKTDSSEEKRLEAIKLDDTLQMHLKKCYTKLYELFKKYDGSLIFKYIISQSLEKGRLIDLSYHKFNLFYDNFCKNYRRLFAKIYQDSNLALTNLEQALNSFFILHKENYSKENLNELRKTLEKNLTAAILKKKKYDELLLTIRSKIRQLREGLTEIERNIDLELSNSNKIFDVTNNIEKIIQIQNDRDQNYNTRMLLEKISTSTKDKNKRHK